MHRFTRLLLCTVVTAAGLAAPSVVATAAPQSGLKSGPTAVTSTTFTPLAASALPGTPRDVAVSPDGSWGYVVGSAGLSKVNLRTSPPTITGTASTLSGLADVVSPDGRTVYYITLSGLYAADVTGTTPTLLSNVGFPVNGAVLHGIAVSGQTLFVSYGDGQPNGLPYGVYAFDIANRVPSALGMGSTQPFPVDVAATRTATRSSLPTDWGTPSPCSTRTPAQGWPPSRSVPATSVQ